MLEDLPIEEQERIAEMTAGMSDGVAEAFLQGWLAASDWFQIEED